MDKATPYPQSKTMHAYGKPEYRFPTVETNTPDKIRFENQTAKQPNSQQPNSQLAH